MTNTLNGSISRVELIALVAALMALNSLAIDIMLPALPAMGAALSIVNENERQFIITSYMFGYGFGEIIFGPLSDRFGRRWPLLCGLAVYAAAAIAAIVFPAVGTVLARRFVQGVGAASIRVIATSIVRDRYSGSAMAEVMSVSFMLLMAIPILAPSIGQMLLLVGPWQAIFLFMGGFAAIVGLWTFKDSPRLWQLRTGARSVSNRSPKASTSSSPTGRHFRMPSRAHSFLPRYLVF